MPIVTDGRVVGLQQILIARWKNEVKGRPPADRDSYLRSQEAIIALGAKQCAALRRGISEALDSVSRLVPSGAWLEAWWAHNQKMPCFTPDAGRQYSVRMMLSRGLVQVGEESVPHRRWTPPQAVDVEDMLDCMGNTEAMMHDHPPSPSAVAIHRMCAYSKAGLRRLAGDGRW